MIPIAEYREEENRLFFEENGELIAELHFEKEDGNRLNADHTMVVEQYQGQGFGEQLVEKLVEYSREKEFTVVPTCPFVKQKLEENKQYQDVLHNK
ncbi:GNAT family N-acetyltransferase [Pseudalkalibacillus caeni]|uniref:N-acetyltransferase n=1 Tax=Exobacillus caeni TaxID=2574798 RepID=A0A5R9F5U8_9BACL|nr:GNAT family N-acetyltransferase [Pseudalkalibacillus caeni]TLS38917.1 N-acetyltransferase [Pseudalkalibacillus caeni]